METAALVRNPPSEPLTARHRATPYRWRKLGDAKTWSEVLHQQLYILPGMHGRIMKECRRASVSIVVPAHALKAFAELTRGSVRNCVIEVGCIFMRLRLQVGGLGAWELFQEPENGACCCLDCAQRDVAIIIMSGTVGANRNHVS